MEMRTCRQNVLEIYLYLQAAKVQPEGLVHASSPPPAIVLVDSAGLLVDSTQGFVSPNYKDVKDVRDVTEIQRTRFKINTEAERFLHIYYLDLVDYNINSRNSNQQVLLASQGKGSGEAVSLDRGGETMFQTCREGT
jgi:hypothetical protein